MASTIDRYPSSGPSSPITVHGGVVENLQQPSHDPVETIPLDVSFKGNIYHFDGISSDLTVGGLQDRIENETGIPPEFQKLFASKFGLIKASTQIDKDVELFSLLKNPNQRKIMLIGSTPKELKKMQQAEANSLIDQQRRYQPRNNGYRSFVASAMNTPRTVASSQYTFEKVVPLPHFADSRLAGVLLNRLKNDRGVCAVMEKHKWKVPVLTELDPASNSTHEVKLLGLNRNKGEVILLRLRTDDYGGFRDYNSIRNVLCHELAHNVFSEHDEQFWGLCKQLEQEVIKLDPYGSRGHALGEVYTSPDRSVYSKEEADHVDGGGLVGGSYILGNSSGSSSSASSSSSTSSDNVRDVLRKAAEDRNKRDTSDHE